MAWWGATSVCAVLKQRTSCSSRDAPASDLCAFCAAQCCVQTCAVGCAAVADTRCRSGCNIPCQLRMSRDVASTCACAECTHQEMNPPAALLAVLSRLPAGRWAVPSCVPTFRPAHLCAYTRVALPPPSRVACCVLYEVFLVHCAMHTT